jgi:hypothetical protein
MTAAFSCSALRLLPQGFAVRFFAKTAAVTDDPDIEILHLFLLET